MRLPFSRPCALFLALCLSLLLAGCASTLRLAYGQADTLLYWRLDSYLDFSSEQAPRVREGLAQFMSWHRRTQLPRYADELQRLRPLLAQPDLGAESICKAVDQLRATVETPLLDPANWPLLWMAGELSAEQLQHLERKQRVADEKWKAEWLDITPEQPRAAPQAGPGTGRDALWPAGRAAARRPARGPGPGPELRPAAQLPGAAAAPA